MAATSSKTPKIENGAKLSAVKPTPAEVSEMEAQIEVLKAEIAKLTSQISSSGERSFEALKSIAAEGAGQLRSQGEAAVAGLKANADDMEAQMVARVREKPITSLAIAAGVGFLFALMARR